MERRFRSEALRSLHEIAEDLAAVGAIDEATRSRLTLAYLVSTPLSVIEAVAEKPKAASVEPSEG
jgi:hypothetical protein